LEISSTSTRATLASVVAALTLSALAAITGADEASAHTYGTGLCGVVDVPPVAVYAGQYTNPDGSHYHRWEAPDHSIFDQFCGYNP
jgi:hypothetical protein